jgi:hypothetical protein
MSDKHQDSEKRPDQQDQDKANTPTPDQAPKKEMPEQPSSPDKA